MTEWTPDLEKSAEQQFKKLEQHILSGGDNGGWNDIVFSWKRLPLKCGGTLKRKGVYGKIIYSYNGREITRVEALEEVAKPVALRRALIEAETSIECSVCGLVVVGKEALNPYQSWVFYKGKMYEKRMWGLMFYRMNGEESVTLSVCPSCMDDIASGKFRESWG